MENVVKKNGKHTKSRRLTSITLGEKNLKKPT